MVFDKQKFVKCVVVFAENNGNGCPSTPAATSTVSIKQA